MNEFKPPGMRLLDGDKLKPEELRQAMEEIRTAMSLVAEQGLPKEQADYVLDKLQTLLELATVLHAKTLN